MFAVAVGADGWTEITPSADTQTIYVSSSGGLDTNSGLSPETPVQTLFKAKSLLRGGMPDWMLLKRGDVWYERISTWNKAGRSEQEPVVVSAYGEGNRPLLNTGNQSGFATNVAAVRHLAIVGLHFNSHTNDPADPAYTGEHGSAGFYGVAPVKNLLIEDSYFEHYGVNLLFQNTQGPVSDIKVRRSVIADAHGGKTQGSYVNGVDGILFEENLFDHNGWSEEDSADGASIYNHNVYMSATNTGVVVRGNIFANASSHGLQARSGGVITDNVFLRNPIGMLFGNGSSFTPGGVFGTVSGNVVLDSRDIGGDTRGWGIGIGNTKPGGGTIVEHNIIANDTLGTHAAIRVELGNEPSNSELAVGINDLTIRDNIVYNWHQGFDAASGLVPGGDDWKALTGLYVRDNEFQHVRSNRMAAHGFPLAPAFEGWSGNTYWDESAASQWFSVQGVANSFDQWRSAVEPTASRTRQTYADPTRTAESYNESLGGEASLDAFLAEARVQSRADWRPQFTAKALGDYIKEGFEVDASVPTVGLDADDVRGEGKTGHTFVVEYNDDSGIELGSLGNADVRVTGPNGYDQLARLANVGTAGARRSVVYHVQAPGGDWGLGDDGVYSVSVEPGQVIDLSGNFVAAGVVGAFNVQTDITPPRATASALAVTTGGGATHQFQVTYTDNRAVDNQTLTGGDVQVTGPDGFSSPVKLLRVDLFRPGTPRTATYSLAAPGGAWDDGDNGGYTIVLQPRQVADTSGNFHAGGAIGGFTVSVPAAPPAAPSELTASPVSTTRIDLAWSDASDDETSFKIEASPRSDFGAGVRVYLVPPNAESFSVSGLSPATPYYFRVRASGASSVPDSAYSNTATASTEAPASVAPTILSPPAALPGLVTGTSTALSVAADDDGGESGLRYTWDVLGAPPAPVTFSANGTNAAKATIATFAAPGRYTFEVTVNDGLLVTAAAVDVFVQPTLSTITVLPEDAFTPLNGQVFFRGQAADQFGTGLPAALAWSVSGGGQIDAATGTFTASAIPGTYTVTAASGAVKGTATLTVGNTAPTVARPAAASAGPAPLTTAALSVLGGDDGGAANLSYTWAATSAPAGAPAPKFSVNGTGAAANTVATFSRAGTYGLRVTISDGGQSVSTSVSYTVNAALRSVVVSPGGASVAAGAGQQFRATARDQFSQPLAPQPAFAWAVSGGGGTVDAGGLYAAPAAAGSAVVTATAGGVSGSVAVAVTSSAGGDSLLLEAEAAAYAGASRASGSAGYTGTGYVDYSAATGGYIEWTAYRPAAGPHTLTFRYANGSGKSERPLELTVNGVAQPRVSFPPTGAWTAWKTVEVPATLAAGENKIRLTTVGANGANFDSLAVVAAEPVNAAPTVARAAAATAGPAAGTTATLSVLGADDGGASNLAYTWAATGLPTGAPAPTFSVNANNAAAYTTATFSRAGTYALRVTISDGEFSTTSTVSYTVAASVKSVAVSPTSLTVTAGTSRQLSAVARDQFGQPVSPQPGFAWAIASGAGAVDSKGLYTAPAVAGAARVTATAAGVSGSSSVTIKAAAVDPQPGALIGEDVGNIVLAGSDSVSNGVHTVTGSGDDIFGRVDGFRFVHRTLAGDGTVVARVISQQNTNAYAKAGVIIREGEGAGVRSVYVVVSPSNGVSFGWRSNGGGTTTSKWIDDVTAPVWLKITRSGNSFAGFYSADGVAWEQIGAARNIDMNASAEAGLAVSSHSLSKLSTATFDNVSVASATDLALGKAAAASSTADGLAASGATDGKGDTRWSSAAGDGQWISVDLGTSQDVNRVRLNWSEAYGTSYQIQVSDTAQTWATVYSTTSGDGNVDDVNNLAARGRYVRVLAETRSTRITGYTLWDFNVYAV